MLALLLLAAAAQTAPPQDALDPQRGRPRVALVLSSGGAHALSEVGALAALEELRVPVDLVVGSGTGALIGGLYAAGRSPQEIHDRMQDRVWLDALTGKVPRTLMSWRQRSVSRDFLLDLPIALGPERVGVARGLARTRWISWLLADATLDAAGVATFDELPVPFRAVATDLLRGESVVLDAGDLPAAILAAMSMPGLYAPIALDGRELSSGSLLMPIPVEPALESGADVLVVVDCTLELDRVERLSTFLRAYEHVRVLAGDSARRAALARLRPSDVLVSPDPGTADEEDFRNASGVYESGYAAVMERAADLARYALAPEEWERHVVDRRARRSDPPEIADVRFEDASELDESILRARVDTTPGERADPRRVSDDLLRLYGLDYHERIDARVVPRADGRADLLFDMHGAPDYVWNPRAGIALEGVFGEDATFALGGAFTLRPIGDRGAEWRNRIEVGSRIRVVSEYWMPIDESARWFVAPSVGYEQRRVNLTDDEDVLAIADVSAVGASLEVGRVLGEWGEARIGLLRQAGRVGLAVGTPSEDGVDSATFDEGYFRGRVTVDTVDSLALPSEGSIGRVVVTSPVKWLAGDEQSYLQAQIDHAVTWDRTTFVFGAEFDTALNDQEALENAFPLGGFLRLSGLGRDRVSGAHVALGRIASWTQLGRRGLDRRVVEWNLGGSLEAGQAWARRDEIALDDLRWSGSVFVAADTILGTIFFGAGITEPGETAMFIVFGNLFGDWGEF